MDMADIPIEPSPMHQSRMMTAPFEHFGHQIFLAHPFAARKILDLDPGLLGPVDRVLTNTRA